MDEDTIKLFVPKFLLDLAHEFRVKLNPIYADENYETDLIVDIPLKELQNIMRDWGCEIDHPNQFWYPDQVTSGHIYLENGKQFHMRVYKHKDGFLVKGHVEWHGVTHPIRHIMYANLDYEKGYRMLKNFCEKSGLNILIDKGKGVFDTAEKAIKSKKRPRFWAKFMKSFR